MESQVEAVLAEYAVRAADEAQRVAEGENIPIDDQLISVGPIVGALMNGLVRGIGAKSILELGTAYGGSTIWLAEAAQATGGRVVSLDIAGHKQAYAQQM